MIFISILKRFKIRKITWFTVIYFQEMILDTVEGKSVPRFLVYDIVRFEVSYGCIHWLFNWKREVIKTYFEMFPTKNLNWFFFFKLIFDISLVTLTQIKFSLKSIFKKWIGSVVLNCIFKQFFLLFSWMFSYAKRKMIWVMFLLIWLW